LNDPLYDGRKSHKRNPGGKFVNCDGEALSMHDCEPQVRMGGLNQEEEIFYWTADNSSAGGGEGSSGHDSGNVYPSYKKKMANNIKSMRPSLEENHLINAAANAAAAQEYNYQFQHQMQHHHPVHNPRFYSHQHQISSDDDHPESHLIHGMHNKLRRGPGGPSGVRMHAHQNDRIMASGMSGIHHESRFHQYYQQQHEEPVYEEILSNRSRRNRISGSGAINNDRLETDDDYNYEVEDESEQECEKDKTDYLDDAQRNRNMADKHLEHR
jgi:hypothetical protein